MITVTDFFVNSTKEENQTLELGIRHRDPEVLDLLIEQYYYRLFRYLLHLTGNRGMAEDIFQETWMKVLERGHQYNGQSKFEAWLFTIARNLVFDRLRGAKNAVSLNDLTQPGKSGSQSRHPVAKQESPLDSVERLEQGEQTIALLGKLPALYREALVLRFQEALSLEEIASVVEAPLSTVKSRIYRGLRLLRETLEETRT